MLIQWFCDLLFRIWDGLFSWVNIPKFDDALINDINLYIDTILVNGRGLVSFFVPTKIFDTLLIILLGIISIKYTYFVVLWIIKKIPVAGMQ